MKVTIDTGVAPYSDAWAGFRGEDWKNTVNVRDFIQHNYTPYEGDDAFLAQATPATTAKGNGRHSSGECHPRPGGF